MAHAVNGFHLHRLQISDNPELFQPLVEENIRAANAGEIINDRVWGERVRHLLEGSAVLEPLEHVWPRTASCVPEMQSIERIGARVRPDLASAA